MSFSAPAPASSAGTSPGNSTTWSIGSALESIAVEDKRDFLQALERVPFLVEMESNPNKFMQREGYDVRKAIKRLCLYWKYRCEIFGSERAFCPMTLTGDGAFSPEDVEAFCTGMLYPVVGRACPALYVDKKLNYDQPPPVRRRIHFYAMQLMSEFEASISPGFTVLAYFNSMSLDTVSRVNFKVLNEGLPVQMDICHIFCVPEEQSSLVNFFARFAVLVSTIFNKVLYTRTLLHSNPNVNQRLQKIVSLGFSPDTVPTSLGGTFTRADFDAWVRERQEVERQRYLDFWFGGSSQIERHGAVTTAAGGSGVLRQLLHQEIPRALQSSVPDQRLRLSEAGTSNFTQLQSPFNLHFSSSTTHGGSLGYLLPVNQNPDPIGSLQYSRNMAHVDPASFISSNATQHVSTGVVAKLKSLVEETKPSARPKGSSGCNDSAYTKLGIEGACIGIEETETIRKTAGEAFEEVLALIPYAEKSAYLEARRRCPRLAETETNVMQFVRRDEYDVSSAVNRILRYWRLRLEVFGQRAFLPMTQTGHGALTREDVVILRSGVVALLPKDIEGRSVVMEDRNRILDDKLEAQNAKLRSLFYVLSLLSDDDRCREDGFIWVSAVITPRVTEIWKEFSIKTLKILDCFPIRLMAAHLLVYPPKHGKRKKIDDIVSFSVKIFEEQYGRRAILTTGEKAADLASKLHQFDLSEDSIPAVLGGSWAYEQWITFLRQKSQEERAKSVGNGAAGTKSVAIAVSAMDAKPLSEAERRDHKRKLNTIYSRQKRERQQAEVDRMQERCKEIEATNRTLEADNRRLEQLLEQAKNVLLDHGIALPSTNDVEYPCSVKDEANTLDM